MIKKNYDVEDTGKVQKKKSGLGGLLGSVFKGILGSLGSVAFGLTPSLLGMGLLIRKIANPFLLITGVAFTTLNVIVSKTGKQFKELDRKVDKGRISEDRVIGGARNVTNALLQAAYIFVGGQLAGSGIKRAIGGRLVTRKQAQEIGVKETIKELIKTKKADTVIKNRGRIIQKTLTSDSGYGSGSALAEVPNPAKIRGQFTMKGIQYPLYDSALSPAENMLRFINAEAGYVNKKSKIRNTKCKKTIIYTIRYFKRIN